jgi:hypothetical protein
MGFMATNCRTIAETHTDLFIPPCSDGYRPSPFLPRRKCQFCTNEHCYLVRSLIQRSRLLD